MKLFIVALLVAISYAQTACTGTTSDWACISQSFQANTQTSGAQEVTEVSALDSNGFVVAWESPSGSADKVYFQRYEWNSESGYSKAGAETLVSDATSFQQIKPSVTGLSNGGFAIAYLNYPRYSSTADQVCVTCFNSQGVSQGSHCTDRQISSEYARIGIMRLTNGGFRTFYNTDDTGFKEVRSERFSNTCESVQGAVKMNSQGYRINGYSRPQGVELSSNGDFALTWISFPSTENQQTYDGTWEVYVGTYNADGSQKRTEFIGSQSSDFDQLFQSIASFPDGSFIVVWQSNEQDNNFHNIYARKFNANGNPNGSEFKVPQSNGGVVGHVNPDVVTYSDGSYAIFYQAKNKGNDDDHNVYANYFDSSNQVVGGDAKLHQITGKQGYPRATVTGDGFTIVVFRSDVEDGSDYNIDGVVIEKPEGGNSVDPETPNTEPTDVPEGGNPVDTETTNTEPTDAPAPTEGEDAGTEGDDNGSSSSLFTFASFILLFILF